MTINNKQAFLEGLWDWQILDGCFGNTCIHPTDVDGVVERHGWFLYFETKCPNVDPPSGQTKALIERANDGISTVLLIFGDRNVPQKILCISLKGSFELNCVDLSKFRSIVSRWFDWADKHKKKRVLKDGKYELIEFNARKILLS